MQVITIEVEAFKEIVSKIDAINLSLATKENVPTEKWLDNKEFMKLMNVSIRTAQSYRDEGIISFSQIGNKIFYKRSDIEALLMKNYRKAFKPCKKVINVGGDV